MHPCMGRSPCTAVDFTYYYGMYLCWGLNHAPRNPRNMVLRKSRGASGTWDWARFNIFGAVSIVVQRQLLVGHDILSSNAALKAINPISRGSGLVVCPPVQGTSTLTAIRSTEIGGCGSSVTVPDSCQQIDLRVVICILVAGQVA